MNGDLGIKEIDAFINALLEETNFKLEDYFSNVEFSELYNRDETFHQVSIYARLDNKFKKHYLEVLKKDKVNEFEESVTYINAGIEQFINELADNTEVVPSYEKDTFLYFRRVPSDFGISYSIYERNRARERREEQEARESHFEESGLKAFIEKHGYNPCEDCYGDCHRCSYGFYDDGRYGIYDVYSTRELI